MEKEKRMWIIPENDLEAKVIGEMLEREGEEYLVTLQSWGTSWENLEQDLKDKIEKARQNGKKIYGVELKGNSNGAINIDHHIYENDDRSNPKSSIEQVAEILGIELSLYEKFVAANDKGYILGMKRLGAELGIEDKDLQAIITKIRKKDRQAQKITEEEEKQAQAAIDALGDFSKKREGFIVNLPHSRGATIQDRIYEKYNYKCGVQNILILSEDGEVDFDGDIEFINALSEKFPEGWKGGALDEGRGFWGGYVDQEMAKSIVQSIIDKRIKAKKNTLEER